MKPALFAIVCFAILVFMLAIDAMFIAGIAFAGFLIWAGIALYDGTRQ